MSKPSSAAVVSLIPLCQLLNGNLDKPVALCPMVEGQNLLTDSVTTDSWQGPDPEPVIDTTPNDDSNASHNVCSVPERHISLSTRWWVPWHDKEEEIHENRKNDDCIPGVKYWTGEIQSTPSPANDEKTDG